MSRFFVGAIVLFPGCQFLCTSQPSGVLQPLLPGMQLWSHSEVVIGETTGRILALGDWGCGLDIPAGCATAEGQRDVAKAMGQHAGNTSVDFVLNLGDSFYPYGVEFFQDQKFNSTFTDMYSSEHLEVPWYGVLGNHDWRRNASALVTKRGRWQIPSLAYTLKGRANGIPFTFFMIDSNAVLRTNICHGRNSSSWGPLSPAESEICQQGLAASFAEQKRWLQDELRKAEGELKIVVSHHPVYSTGRWAFAGNNEDISLEEDLDPILHQEKVHAYISGHDHIFAHYARSDIDYFVMGASGGEFEDQPRYEATNATVIAERPMTFGFSQLDINRTHFCFSFLDAKIAAPNYQYCKRHSVLAADVSFSV